MYELFQGDSVDVLQSLVGTKYDGNISLVYLDPPYGTGRDFDEYDDRWETRQHLVDFLVERIKLLHRLLSANGSILVHVDYRIINNIALVLDDVFGAGDRDTGKTKPGFRNELIWVYGLGGSSSRFYPRKHDNILWYTKSDKWVFHPPMTPATSQRLKGKLKKQPDVLDIPSINNMARERTGYPTQKPIELLDLLVCAHSNPADVILDPFCGSGTTVVASVKNGRFGIGIDVNTNALKITEKRLKEIIMTTK